MIVSGFNSQADLTGVLALDPTHRNSIQLSADDSLGTDLWNPGSIFFALRERRNNDFCPGMTGSSNSEFHIPRRGRTRRQLKERGHIRSLAIRLGMK
jgi:hypothetical protein